MKPILTTTTTDTILLDLVNERHFVVMKKDGHGFILTREAFEQGKFYFMCLTALPTQGNRFRSRHETYRSAIIDNIDHIQIFTTYKEALTWLCQD